MKIQSYLPCPLLAPYIKEYMFIESIEGTINKTLPDTSVVMAFRLDGKVDYKETNGNGIIPKMVISGLRKSHRTFTYYENTKNLLVKFKEGGASFFFKEPIHELFSLSVSLDSILKKNLLNQIEDQLSEAKNNEECVAIIESFLISRFVFNKNDLVIQKAIQRIQSLNGNIRINSLINDFPVSRDAFEKRFRKFTGTSPKQYSTIIKLNNLVNRLTPDSNLLDTAFTSGYYDQSHFIKDFKLFTGELPHNFIKYPRRW